MESPCTLSGRTHDTRQKADYGIHQHHGCKFSARKHVVAYADFVRGQVLPYTLINPLVVAADQHHPGSTSQFLGYSLMENVGPEETTVSRASPGVPLGSSQIVNIPLPRTRAPVSSPCLARHRTGSHRWCGGGHGHTPECPVFVSGPALSPQLA